MKFSEYSSKEQIVLVLVTIARIVVGATFLFSGFVKAVDPLGTAFKLNDYFQAFGMDYFKGLGIYLSLALLSVEMTVGITLIFNIWNKFSIWIVTMLTVFFTWLTFFIALTDPVSDCGCFGDAIKISNWATFYKNIVLLVLAFIILLIKKQYTTYIISLRLQKILWFVYFLFSLSFGLYSLNGLPSIDFRPYKTGTNLIEARKMPDNAKPDEFKNFFYYEKNGEIKKFDEENYPWQDSTWNFMEMESVLVKKGYESPYKNLAFFDSNQNDITESLLQSREYTWLLISYDISAIPLELYERLHNFLLKAEQQDIQFSMVTSANDSDIKIFEYRAGVILPVIHADEILLKTIIRANPGIVVLRDGVIIGKWNFKNIKDDSEILKPLESSLGNNGTLKTQLIIINLAAIILVILLVTLGIEKIKNKYF